MLNLLPPDILSHICSFIDEDYDRNFLDLIVHSHDHDGYQFHATKSFVQCWHVRIARMVLPITPIADEESGMRYEVSIRDFGLDMCSDRTCHADGSISFFTMYGESITLYNWIFKKHAIPMTGLYDAVIDKRWSDLPSGKIVQLYKIPRIPTSDSLPPGKITFDDGHSLTLHNRFLLVCDPQRRRRWLLSHSPEVMLKFSDIEQVVEKHHRIDRDREGTLAVMDANKCIYGGSLYTHYRCALDDLVSSLVSKNLHLARGLALNIRGQLTDMTIASLDHSA